MILGLFLPETGGVAAGPKTSFGIRGAGLMTCAAYEKEREARSDIYLIVAGWIGGYVTGVNQYAPDAYDVASFESVSKPVR